MPKSGTAQKSIRGYFESDLGCDRGWLNQPVGPSQEGERGSAITQSVATPKKRQGPGDYVSTRILGRWQFMNANDNRICRWTKLTERDGDLHVYGLNHHGRVLVDAVRVGSGPARFGCSPPHYSGEVVNGFEAHRNDRAPQSRGRRQC